MYGAITALMCLNCLSHIVLPPSLPYALQLSEGLRRSQGDETILLLLSMQERPDLSPAQHLLKHQVKVSLNRYSIYVYINKYQV